LVAGAGFEPHSGIDSREVVDSTMFRMAKKAEMSSFTVHRQYAISSFPIYWESVSFMQGPSPGAEARMATITRADKFITISVLPRAQVI
jgi:hypothetical protein